jgi:DNA repair photolyase
MQDADGIRARGAAGNPPIRFESTHYERGLDDEPDEGPAPTTQFLKDTSRTIIAHNDSPDVGFSASINPYRGCEHGCIYCYARPTHEYLGFSAGLDFETKILVKEDAPELLRRELGSSGWQPEALGISGVTDPYQPIERRLGLTRRCLEVLVEFRNPAFIITKNHLVTRDIDLLQELTRYNAGAVFLSPRTSPPAGRLAAIEALARAGVPVGVMVAPVIPGLTDHEIPNLVAACAQAGAQYAGYTPIRLPFAVKDLFADWLERHFPDKKEKVLGRIREIRSGKLNDSRFGVRMRGEGQIADAIHELFDLAKRKAGIKKRGPELSTASFRKRSDQPSLFE